MRTVAGYKQSHLSKRKTELARNQRAVEFISGRSEGPSRESILNPYAEKASLAPVLK